MTTKLPIRDVDDVVDVDLYSKDVLVGGCLRGIVTDIMLSTDTGKQYKFLSLNDTSKNLAVRNLLHRAGDPAVSSW